MNPSIPAKRKTTFAAICIGFLGVIQLAHGSTLLTFDDLSPGTDYVVISNYYGGLLWGNFAVLDGSLRPATEGYHNGVVSTPNVALNLAGNPAAFSSINGFFDLNSAYLTSQFVNGLQIRVQGFAGTNLLYDNTYVLTTNAPTLINFNYSQVDSVRFVTPSSTWFVLDNLSITLTNGPMTANCSAPASAPVYPGMVQGWGCNYFGQINTACFSNVVAIAAGRDHSLLLKHDSTVVALGAYWIHGSTVTAFTPGGLSNVIAVTCGSSHSLALKSDGTVVAWGDDEYGQTDVPQGLTNVVAISAGSYHSMALKTDGTVASWGGWGINVPDGLTNVVAISGGGNGISLALKANGTVVGWNLGRGADPSTLSNIVAVSAGDNAYIEAWEALRDDGVVLVGNTFFSDTWGPTNVNGVVAISASRGNDGHISWALKADGKVIAMPAGFNFCGGPWVPPGLSKVVAVASGDAHNLALIGDGPPVLQATLLNLSWDANGFHAPVPTENGHVYRLEYKNSLSDASWNGLPLVAGSGALVTLTDPTATGSQRFYRVRRW